jgi:hypothetical protein
MTTRQTISAIERAAGQAEPVGSSLTALILGTLLLLIRP